MNKSPDVVQATKGCLALPVTQSGRAEYRDIRPALLTCPGQQWLGPFPSRMTSANSLSLILRRLAYWKSYRRPRPLAIRCVGAAFQGRIEGWNSALSNSPAGTSLRLLGNKASYLMLLT